MNQTPSRGLADVYAADEPPADCALRECGVTYAVSEWEHREQNAIKAIIAATAYLREQARDSGDAREDFDDVQTALAHALDVASRHASWVTIARLVEDESQADERALRCAAEVSA